METTSDIIQRYKQHLSAKNARPLSRHEELSIYYLLENGLVDEKHLMQIGRRSIAAMTGHKKIFYEINKTSKKPYAPDKVEQKYQEKSVKWNEFLTKMWKQNPNFKNVPLPPEYQEKDMDVPIDLSTPENKQEEEKQVSTPIIIGAAASTPVIGATILSKGPKYQRLPVEPDIEMGEIRPYTDEVPTRQLIDHPMQETRIEMPELQNTGLRQRTNIARNPTTNPNIMEPMDIMDVPMSAGGAAGGGVLGASTSAALGYGAAGVGLLGLGGIAAIATSKSNNNEPKQGYVLPGTDYVGPGNDIHIGPARSGTDQVAKEHDIAYDKLIHKAQNGLLTEEEFKKQLYEIDNTAIQEFSKQEDWQSFIGKWGLKFKTSVEQTINKPIYPSCKLSFINKRFSINMFTSIIVLSVVLIVIIAGMASKQWYARVLKSCKNYGINYKDFVQNPFYLMQFDKSYETYLVTKYPHNEPFTWYNKPTSISKLAQAFPNEVYVREFLQKYPQYLDDDMQDAEEPGN